MKPLSIEALAQTPRFHPHAYETTAHHYLVGWLSPHDLRLSTPEAPPHVVLLPRRAFGRFCSHILGERSYYAGKQPVLASRR